MCYMIYELTCAKPDYFLFAHMAFLNSFLQMCIVLGMYNFAFRAKSSFMCNSLDSRTYLGENLGKTFGILQKFIEICIAITMFTVAT